MTKGLGCISIVVAATLVFLVPSSRAQEMTINLNPRVITETPCTELLSGFDIQNDNINVAIQSAAGGGFRFGYALGYLHGVLDDGEKRRPLTEEEVETFVGTYQLLCKENGNLSIYEAARDSMSFQTR
ncbi:MAG: hypothetical protein GY791_05480 [Alphaproteobacteria bacterium]|nr:hypothetical protein [Alphaproteobacteria bacterium]